MGRSNDAVARLLATQKPLTRVVLVIFGAVLIHLSLGTYHTFGNMLPYMASYMRNYTDDSIRIEQLMWIPMFQGCFPFAMIIGGFLSSKIGTRLAAAVGCMLMSSGVYLSGYSIQHSYWSFLATYGFMFGLGQGMAYVIAVGCVINWAPHMVGLASGIVAAGFGISASIFAPIQTHLVNPDNFPPTKEGYFTQKELLTRVPDTFFSLSIFYFVMQCIGLIFMCDPPTELARRNLANSAALIDMAWLSKRRSHWMSKGKNAVAFSKYGYVRLSATADDDDESDTFASNKRRQHRNSDLTTNDTQMNVTNSTSSGNSHSTDNVGRPTSATANHSRPHSTSSFSDCDTKSDEDIVSRDFETHQAVASSVGGPESFTPQQMLHSSTFYFLFVSLFCCSFYGNMFYNLYKTFAETFISDDFFMAVAFSVGSIANAVARIMWGFLTDKTSFQTTLSVATSWSSVLLFTMPLTAILGKYVYLLWLIMMFICLGATHALFITAIVRCFGTRYKTTNYGCLIFSTTLSGVLLALLSSHALEQIGYQWGFIFTACFPFIAFVLTSAIRVTPQGHLIV